MIMVCYFRWVIVMLTVVRSFADDVIVSVDQGKLSGHRLLTRRGREFLAFQGIPYAKPPVGELRFKRPQPADKWDGVRDATKEGADCLQKEIHIVDTDMTGEEDCLFVNVYTPELKPASLLPVMFWIHGGGWISGCGSSLYYGGDFLLDKDVVLVAINYRLGPLGFLSTGDAECPGNNGLKDQVLGLQWVKDNIAGFGGDPQRVTVFGESAGGGSAHLHTMSPLSRGLFHRVIAMSGTAVAPWAIASPRVALNLTTRLSSMLGCPTESSRRMIECMRRKEAGDIVDMTSRYAEWLNHPLVIFRPVVEAGADAFVADYPSVLLRDRASVADVPIMTGVLSGEGVISAGSMFAAPERVQQFVDDFDTLAPMTMLYGETSPAPGDVTRRIKEFYFGSEPFADDHRRRQAIVNMFTDAFFLADADVSVRMHAAVNTAPVYYYYMDYTTSVSYGSLYGDPSGEDYGAVHGDDTLYLFPNDHLFPGFELSSEDLKLSEHLITIFTEFARTGDPTPAGHAHAHWNPVNASVTDVAYLHIGRDGNVTVRTNLLAERARFWATLPLTTLRNVHTKDEL